MNSFFNRFLKSKLAIVFAVMSIVACSNQEFAGGGDAAAVPVKKKPISPITPTKIDDPSTGTVIKTDDGGTITQKDCADGKAVEDPNATLSWAGDGTRAGDDVARFVNGFNKYTHITVGALHNDADTAKFVCQLQGFLGGVVTINGNFLTPKNNSVYRWNPTNKVLNAANATSGNDTIKAYRCRGKLKDPCKKDQGWIFQQLP